MTWLHRQGRGRMVLVTRRALLPALVCALLLAGCGGSSSSRSADTANSEPAAASSGAGSSAVPAPVGSAAASTPGAAPAVTSDAASTTGGGGATSTTTGTASRNGGTSPAFTAPGTYTYDVSGTVTAGTPRDASGTATLTVDPPAGGRQHTLLGTDQGRTEQDVAVRKDGVYLLQLAMTNPTFSKQFRLTQPGLLVPEPAAVGRSWSWTAKSTDGKTTAAVTARVSGRATVTIGGKPTPTTVISSTLELSGDITYTSQMQNWVDLARRLSVKDQTKGRGTFGGVQFSTDITSVIRSTTPS